MNDAQAKQILAAVREGATIDEATITHALYVCGDLSLHAAVRSARVDCQISPQDWRARIRQRAIVVDESLR